MTARLMAGTAFVVLLLGGPAQAEEPLKSGPPVGARNDRGRFEPQFVAGPFAGQDRCPV